VPLRSEPTLRDAAVATRSWSASARRGRTGRSAGRRPRRWSRLDHDEVAGAVARDGDTRA